MRQVTAAALTLVLTACGASPATEASASRSATAQGGAATPSTEGCADAALAVQVLGSGGPILSDARASSGYLLWIDGRARLLVDLGPGAMARYGAAGASPADLDAILLTHLHVDHSADLAGFLKTASFGDRTAPLPIRGPTGDGAFPSLDDFLRALLADGGAYAYLGGYLGEGQPFSLSPESLDPSRAEPIEAFAGERARVRAIGVPHGPVPALAYEVTVGDTRIGFMGDQRADEERYVEMIRGVDLLVAHMAIGPDPSPVAARLHATPSRLGQVAAEAEVGRMILSHLMPRSLADLDGNLAAVRARYDGPIEVAEDGLCVRLR